MWKVAVKWAEAVEVAVAEGVVEVAAVEAVDSGERDTMDFEP